MSTGLMAVGVVLVMVSAAGLLGAFRGVPAGAVSSPGPSGIVTASPTTVAATAPASSTPAAASPTAPPAPSTVPATPSPSPDRVAAVNALYVRLIPAIRGRDVATLLALLHPATIERYGEAACRTYFGGLNDPGFNVVIRSVAPPAPWTWERDGRSTTIADALAVQADLTANGTTSAQEIHVAPVGGELRWFTDCGTPLA